MAKKTDINLISELDDILSGLGVKYEHNDDLFWIFNRGGDLPAATFLVVPKDSRISFFSALPFEVRAERLEATFFAVNALNDLISEGRFYLDINSTDNAIFFDQYLLAPDGGLDARDISRMIKNNEAAMTVYVDLLTRVNEGKMKVTDFVKTVRQA